MHFLLSGLTQHGYSVLFGIVFLETVGFPIPAALALLIGGGAAAQHSLDPVLALGGALAAMLLGDTLMFLLGRYTGWWLLGMMCRLSLNPESCILRSADSFYRRGRTLLLFAKFVPGMNTMAPPLAGSMNMRYPQFIRLDVVGAFLYIGSYFGVGFAFSDALGAVTQGYQAFSRIVGWVVMAAVAAYLGLQVRAWIQGRKLRSVPFVTPNDAARALSSDGAVIFDVRSHGYYEKKATRIQGSRRLEPNALQQGELDLPVDSPLYLYCTCVKEATSARVAQVLLKRGVPCAVIKGGLRAWKKAGLPVEPVPSGEIAPLPVFD